APWIETSRGPKSRMGEILDGNNRKQKGFFSDALSCWCCQVCRDYDTAFPQGSLCMRYVSTSVSSIFQRHLERLYATIYHRGHVKDSSFWDYFPFRYTSTRQLLFSRNAQIYYML
ncbi:hypothetical protein M514_04370, partial [Trichuris suis]